jgi:hypothetical protein
VYFPNATSSKDSFNYENLDPVPFATNGPDLRIDQVISQKQQLHARFSARNITTDVAYPLLPNDTDFISNRSLVVSYNYALTPRRDSKTLRLEVLYERLIPLLGRPSFNRTMPVWREFAVVSTHNGMAGGVHPGQEKL